MYFVAGAGKVKIGRSIQIDTRLAALRANSPVDLTLARFIACVEPVVIEVYLHRRYAAHRLHNEWFAAGPVLDDIATLADADILAGAGYKPVTITGRAQKLARYLRTREGRDVGAGLPLRLVLTDRRGEPHA